MGALECKGGKAVNAPLFAGKHLVSPPACRRRVGVLSGGEGTTPVLQNPQFSVRPDRELRIFRFDLDTFGIFVLRPRFVARVGALNF